MTLACYSASNAKIDAKCTLIASVTACRIATSKQAILKSSTKVKARYLSSACDLKENLRTRTS